MMTLIQKCGGKNLNESLMKVFTSKIMTPKYLLVLCTMLVFFSSCEDKSENYEGVLSPYIAIEDIRVLHKGTDLLLDENHLNGAFKIYGTVISDHRFGNVPEGTIILQQFKRNRLRGLALHVGDDAKNYLPGDSIVVEVRNKLLVKKPYLTIEDLVSSDIEKISSKNKINGIVTVIGNILRNPENYEGTMVQIVGGQMFPKPQDGDVFEGSKLMIQGKDTISVNTLPSADYAKLQVPRNINVTGIILAAEKNSPTKFYVYPRFKNDIVDVSDPDVPEYIGATPIIITGFCNDPSGSDANYEYIQLKANTDIDFSKVPFSLVTSNNAGEEIHTAGWVTGGSKTYKFNLTSGTVKKGEYFYVGGHRKMINGANSTAIAGVKWIRTISTSNTPGDGFGNQSSNILANSGKPAGIAIFVGTNISEQSVPIDVIFFGNNETHTVINKDKTLGYRIVNNDHYVQYIQETGESTPFFLGGDSGVNSFRFEHHGGVTNTDIGYFFQLGGKFNTTTRKWEAPRERTLIFLNKQSQIEEIEQGTGSTIQIN